LKCDSLSIGRQQGPSHQQSSVPVVTSSSFLCSIFYRKDGQPQEYSCIQSPSPVATSNR
jgi:hypothetical protein